ncbi:hypothetical protein FS837_007010 [Tulasnella sp. UAMH 9824]|nr:hypothetical protein FS837_007010 [Tulasnella sp. UAMH 9824]
MAATTGGVPATSIEDLMKGKGLSTLCDPAQLFLIEPGYFAIVPGVCTLLSEVPHGNFFAVPLENSLRVSAGNSLEFLMDPRIIHTWDYQLDEGVKYLKKVIQPVGPYGSSGFCEASEEIGIPPQYWLVYLSEGIIPHYLAPLANKSSLETALHHAKRARDQLIGLYSFISLLRQRTIGKDTIFRCPEDNINWRFHTLYCQTGISPRMDVPERANESNPYLDPSQEEAGVLAHLQLQRVQDLNEQCRQLEEQLRAVQAQNAELSGDLAAVMSERGALLTEVGRSKRVLRRTLNRACGAENVLTVLHVADYRITGFLPGGSPASTPSTSSSILSCALPSMPSSTSSFLIALDKVKKEEIEELD